MRKIKIEATIEYTVEVDDNNEIVKEYSSDIELAQEIVSYKFSNVLPVIEDGGIKLIDTDIIEVELIESRKFEECQQCGNRKCTCGSFDYNGDID